MQSLAEPLTDSDLNRLEQLLSSLGPRRAMSLPETDGFLCALVCGPNSEKMSDRLGQVLGVEMHNGLPLHSLHDGSDEARLLLARHWNTIADTLAANQPYLPIYDLDDEGQPLGHAWALSFAHGMRKNKARWDRYIQDRNHGDMVALVMMLVAEARPGWIRGGVAPPISREKRAELLVAIAACLLRFFHHFHPGGRASERNLA